MLDCAHVPSPLMLHPPQLTHYWENKAEIKKKPH